MPLDVSIDFEYAKMMQSTIKLLGVSKKLNDHTIAVYVSPMLVPLSNDIAGIGGAENVVNIESKVGTDTPSDSAVCIMIV